ncbi:di-heme oxidoredictase family protein [Azospirillum sp. HJ39]|uniref:di-heme oxidoredictase family protein n=1 Tax=Azospirillum sp. HJ39 TaxID=3159496 RepID=UPI00355874E8
MLEYRLPKLRRAALAVGLLLSLAPAAPAAHAAESLDNRIGEALFRRMWVAAPTATQAADGLGPLYNARSCATCHPRGGGGRPPDPAVEGDQGVGYVIKLNDDPVYGRQIQSNAVLGQVIEGRPRVTYREEKIRFPDGATVRLRRPMPVVTDLGYGPLAEATVMSARVSPRVHGMGLLDRIPADAIEAEAARQAAAGGPVVGRVNRVTVAGKPEVGRFGWKAMHPTLDHQDAEAFSLDIGMSTPAFPDPWGDCTPAQTACRTAPHGDSKQFEGLEIPSTVIGLIDGYLRDLQPDGSLEASKDKAGTALFIDTGCAACHRPSWRTAVDPAHPSLSDRDIFPHSDMLLHDLGPGLADALPMGEARGQDWRTTPLWGLNRLAAKDGQLSLLHDGRARSVTEAILWHGGEAEEAKGRFMNLPAEVRKRLVRYVLGL